MHQPETVRRFIELRARGWTYARLETELATRNLAELTTPQLMSAARNLRRQMRASYRPAPVQRPRECNPIRRISLTSPGLETIPSN